MTKDVFLLQVLYMHRLRRKVFQITALTLRGRLTPHSRRPALFSASWISAHDISRVSAEGSAEDGWGFGRPHVPSSSRRRSVAVATAAAGEPETGSVCPFGILRFTPCGTRPPESNRVSSNDALDVRGAVGGVFASVCVGVPAFLPRMVSDFLACVPGAPRAVPRPAAPLASDSRTESSALRRRSFSSPKRLGTYLRLGLAAPSLMRFCVILLFSNQVLICFQVTGWVSPSPSSDTAPATIAAFSAALGTSAELLFLCLPPFAFLCEPPGSASSKRPRSGSSTSPTSSSVPSSYLLKSKSSDRPESGIHRPVRL